MNDHGKLSALIRVVLDPARSVVEACTDSGKIWPLTGAFLERMV